MKNENNEHLPLEEELENLRALVEKTLKEEGESFKKEKKEEKALKNKKNLQKRKTKKIICSRCQKELDESSFVGGSSYCGECRKAMISSPVRLRGAFALILTFVIFIGSLITSMSSVISFTDASSVDHEYFFEGYISYRDGLPVDAAAYYQLYLNQRQDENNVSEKAVRQLIDSYYRMGEYPAAAQIIETYYSELELSLPWNYKYKKITEKNELISATYQAIIEAVTEHSDENGTDLESVISCFEEMKSAAENGEEPLYSVYVLDVFIFDYSAAISGESNEKLYEKLQALDKKYGNDEWEHLPMLCNYAVLCGDSEGLEQYKNRMEKINPQDISYLGALFDYYRFNENPDTDKLLELCEKMAQSGAALYQLGRYNFDYLYYYTIAYMLEGNAGEIPFTLVQELYDSINTYGSAYEGNSRQTDILNLYALAAAYTGNTEKWEWVVEEAEYLGSEIGESIIKYKNGEMSLKEVLTRKEGDIL